MSDKRQRFLKVNEKMPPACVIMSRAFPMKIDIYRVEDAVQEGRFYHIMRPKFRYYSQREQKLMTKDYFFKADASEAIRLFIAALKFVCEKDGVPFPDTLLELARLGFEFSRRKDFQYPKIIKPEEWSPGRADRLRKRAEKRVKSQVVDPHAPQFEKEEEPKE